jgi:hypothetical protein
VRNKANLPWRVDGGHGPPCKMDENLLCETKPICGAHSREARTCHAKQSQFVGAIAPSPATGPGDVTQSCETKPICPAGWMVGIAHPTKSLRTCHAKQSQFAGPIAPSPATRLDDVTRLCEIKPICRGRDCLPHSRQDRVAALLAMTGWGGYVPGRYIFRLTYHLLSLESGA